MKKIFQLFIVISLITFSCGKEENPVIPEDDGIRWEHISGRIAYIRQNILYLIDGDSGTIKSLGSTNLTNLKWNKPSGEITGIRFIGNSTYSLEGVDLNGNQSVINNKLSTKFYDWFPDGRLLTISASGALQIDGIALPFQIFYPVFGIACSPDGNKIVISTDNVLENLLIEIDMTTLIQRIVKRSSNILEPDFLQPIYSLESDEVFYVTLTHDYIGGGRFYSLWTNRQLESGKDPCRTSDSQKILFTNLTGYWAGFDGVYLIDIDYGDPVELINYAHSPVWVY
jgi:hypothetical protein